MIFDTQVTTVISSEGIQVVSRSRTGLQRLTQMRAFEFELWQLRFEDSAWIFITIERNEPRFRNLF